ncbi:PDZ domain-containing protein [Borrelia miyamotoi]|uniref:Trypsin-like peptidase domain-containing protein n=1 Tax=Borrelia miyamotoi TaxID=47466 RepID=A0AAX3JME2_9SPIR|nr:trypsin-like peptidase domain-containing protein [Borrelia miyamotoi]QFP42192.1 PDZ domain-containing protein [Borrelia miyamotoi]QFP48306.1 trypsin-like peptidase domain-containing protein [Borrelia miyamotoi]QGT56067.1 PDZ domain-containing protein [Borrelia miyamotoi]QGT56847.1 PDZ domain-containing protein [Borrelia miyamotoi]WAZ72112.1 trypsin-like peptidase domain-containing protein [Borrelia miyamotoi]
MEVYKVKKNFISVFFASLLALATGFFVGIHYLGSDKNTIVFAQEKSNDAVQSLQDSFKSVSKKILPSTVKVYVNAGVAKIRDPFLLLFDVPGLNIERRSYQLGSGVVIGQDSKKSNLFYVITNSHIVDDATDFNIVTYANNTYKAKLVGVDDKKDVALISFEANGADIAVAELGDSDKLEVGDWVIAVGHPHNYTFSVTAGIISGLHRSVNPNLKARNSFIQTDAAINRGNSGGPLVNIRGEVIGINAWIYSPAGSAGGSVGLGFAIPINNAKSVIDVLMSGKKSESAWIGLAFHPIKSKDPEVLKSLGYKEDDSISLAIISGIYEGTSAFKAGLRPGDIISKINGVPMNFVYDVRQYINDFYAKEKIKVEVLRGKEKKDIEIELSAKPNVSNEEEIMPNLKWIPGFSVYPLINEVRSQLGLRNWIHGVVVDSIDSSLVEKSQIFTGDVITAVNSKSVKSLRDFYDAVELKKNVYSILRKGKTVKVSF